MKNQQKQDSWGWIVLFAFTWCVLMCYTNGEPFRAQKLGHKRFLHRYMHNNRGFRFRHINHHRMKGYLPPILSDDEHPIGVMGESTFHPALLGTNVYDRLKVPEFRQDVQIGSQPIPVMRRSSQLKHVGSQLKRRSALPQHGDGFIAPPNIDMHEDHAFENELPLTAEEPVQMTIERQDEHHLEFVDPDKEDPMMNFLWNQGKKQHKNNYIQGYEDVDKDVEHDGKVSNSLHSYHSNNNWNEPDNKAHAYDGGIMSYANNAYTSMQASDVIQEPAKKDSEEEHGMESDNPFRDEKLMTNNEVWKEIRQSNIGYENQGRRSGKSERVDDSLVFRAPFGGHVVQGNHVHGTHGHHPDPPFTWMPNLDNSGQGLK